MLRSTNARAVSSDGPRLPQRTAWLVAGVVAFSAASIAGGGAAHADPNPNRFSLQAQGDAMFIEVDDNTVPATPTNQVGSLTAESAIDSTGGSAAFAGAPYTGSTVSTLPGTANGLAASLAPGAPAIPFAQVPGFVSTTYPGTPTATTSLGPFTASATSAAEHSEATGTTGDPTGLAPNQQQNATSSVTANDDGSVVSTATANIEGLIAGPITDLSAGSTQTVKETAGSAPTFSGGPTAGSFAIAGVTVRFDTSGFSIAGITSPIDATSTLNTIDAQLAASGVQIALVPVTTTTDPVSGIVTRTTGGLQISEVETPPGQSPETLIYILGRTAVSAVDVAFGDDDSGSTDTGTTSTQPSTTTPSTDDTPTTSSTPTQAPKTTTTSVAPVVTSTTSDTAAPAAPAGAPPVAAGTGDVTPSLAPVVDAGAAPPAAVAPVPVLGLNNDQLAAAQTRHGVPLTGTSSRLLYLVLVLGGLMIFGGQLLMRKLGIQLFLHS